MMSGQVSSPNIPGIIAEAKRSERERIIKLLKEHLDGGLMFAEDWNTPGKEIAYTLFKGDIIALIKEGK